MKRLCFTSSFCVDIDDSGPHAAFVINGKVVKGASVVNIAFAIDPQKAPVWLFSTLVELGYKNCDYADCLEAFIVECRKAGLKMGLNEWGINTIELISSPNLFTVLGLAGDRKSPENIQHLAKLLRASTSGSRDVPLYTAAAFDDELIINEVVRIAVTSDYEESRAFGEERVFIFCFRSWLDNDVIDLDKLVAMLEFFGEEDSTRGKTLLNNLWCMGWDSLPYPEMVMKGRT